VDDISFQGAGDLVSTLDFETAGVDNIMIRPTNLVSMG
jgi:hypothetical protein